ncbi:hypothetical protein [Hyalangium rubrum]|uniref:Tetrapyrrole biosynthesis glutamyl-tRNA reductase dimerisation domain-containing protein n=1 Tax=Hyalangium rubrum TaxID=3103134 RepID=A0ABU5HHA9_9BACT|nr:hypothetical protein [Hyalangium sp. s54d21]MDY7231475.1 hypothetical protein [Hyalangium sp. s54d21]
MEEPSGGIRRTLHEVPVLERLWKRAEQIAKDETEKTQAVMARIIRNLGGVLTDAQRESIERLGQTLIGKLLHEPTVRLCAVGPGEEAHQLASAAAELFDLP